jgi:hypothetical protein
MKARICIEHNDGGGVPFHWAPLEEFLSAFIEMVEQKRILANSIYPECEWVEDEFHSPWSIMEDVDLIVNITISAWDSLLSAIEVRLPVTLDSEAEIKYSTDAMEACDLESSFIKKFLQRARVPRHYRYVAPGLRLATIEELSDQPFKKVDLSQICYPLDIYTHRYKWFPFLFLRADRDMPAKMGRYDGYPWNRCTSFSTGLYLHPTKDVERPDGCKLLLPFNVRTNWWVRFGNGEPLGHYAAHDGLYQPGSSIINGDYTLLRLELLFQNWKGMIESGHWTVDENGVSGGIDKFKEADTEEKCGLYYIPRTW